LKIKRYVVREMQEAIRLIKQDMGPEAVIVSSYRVPAKGLAGLFMPRLLEVTAAVDEAPEVSLNLSSPPAQMAVAAGNTEHRQIGPPGVLPAGELQGRPDRKLYLAGGRAEYKGEPGSGQKEESPAAGEREPRLDGGGRSLFEMVVGRQMEAGMNRNPVFRWRRALLNMDLEENVVESLLSDLNGKLSRPEGDGADGESIFFNIKKKAVRLLEPAYSMTERARVLTFVGPTGVGKTTTLAKLATIFSLNDHKKIALVAVHTYRLGAVEQLQAYGDFLGVPVEVVMTPAELARVLESHSDKDHILIDTDGRSARNTGQVLELKSFLDAVKEPQDIFLVLSLTTKNRDLNKIAQEFLKIKYSKIIFTKLDETETLGSILNLVCTFGIPVAYLADGRGMPDSISEAGPKSIARLLFRGVDPDEIMAT